MKKLFSILITSMFVLINSPQLFSQSIRQLDDQYGFRDVKFETPLSSFNGLTEVRKDCYKLKNENLKLGKYELNEVVYRFYKGLLSNIILKVDANNNIGIRLLLINAYGTESVSWTGKKVTLEYMETSPYEQNQVIVFTCNKLRDLEKADEIQAEFDRKQMEIQAKREANIKQMEAEAKAEADNIQAKAKVITDGKQAEAKLIQQLDEDYGFRNIKFETPFSSFKGLIEDPSFGEGCYKLQNENLKLGKYELYQVCYRFYKGLLSDIFLWVYTNNRDGIEDIFQHTYGEGEYESSFGGRSWMGKKVTIKYAPHRLISKTNLECAMFAFTCNKLNDLEVADKIQAKAKAEANKKQKEVEAIQSLDEKYGFRDAKFEMPFSSFKGLIEVPFEESYHQNQNKNLKLGDYQSNEVFVRLNKAFNKGTTEDLNLNFRDAITVQALTSLIKIGKPSKNLSDYELNKMAIQSLNEHKVPFEGYYKLKNENLKVGDYELNEVVYRFYKGILSNIILQMDTKNSKGILQILYNAYGKETQFSDGLRYWLGKKVTMTYRDFRLDPDHVIVVFTCIKLSDLEETDGIQAEAKGKANKKQMEEKAAKDL